MGDTTTWIQNLKGHLRAAFSLGLDLAIIFGLVLFIRTFVVSPFQVDGMSMYPTLHHQDFLWVDRLTYRMSEPRRGDIVVVHPPEGDGFYVKRVIALPGEKISFRSGEVWIQDPAGQEIRLPEPYLDDENVDSTFIDSREKTFFVPEGHVYLMGDNRRHSSDSRSWQRVLGESSGSLAETEVVGRVLVRIPLGIPLWGRIGVPTGFELVRRMNYELTGTGSGSS